MKEKFKKLVHSRMTYAVLLSMLVVGVAAAGAASLSGESSDGEDPYLALEETATPITYGDGSEDAEVAANPGETAEEDYMADDEETVDVYETVDAPVSAEAETPEEETGISETEAAAMTVEETEAVEETTSMEETTEESGDGTVDVSVSDVLSFSEADSLGWPVEGEVIRDFSMDTTVYYSTLDAYKVSPSILIQGEPETTVTAAADGIVTEIGSNEEIGSYVVMDLGNNYELTYGQLDDIEVSVDELVEAGDSIAVLAEPTKYYVMEGCNLYFMLTKDGTAVDPLDYLQ